MSASGSRAARHAAAGSRTAAKPNAISPAHANAIRGAAE